MIPLRRYTAILSLTAGAMLLSGCQLDLLEYSERLEDEKQMAQRVSEMRPTQVSAMPLTGTASFRGHSNFYIDPVVETRGDGIFVLGEAELTADFGAGTLTGEVTNFVGATNVTLNGQNEVIIDPITSVDVSGRIDLGQNVSIIGGDAGDLTSRANDWFMDYEGTLTADGETYALDGEVSGQFYGTRVNNPDTDMPIKALAGAENVENNSTATRASDGAVIDMGLAVIAEN